MRYYKKHEQRGSAGLQAKTGESEAGPAAVCWLNSHDQEGVPPQPDVSHGFRRATIHMKETQQSKETKTEGSQGGGPVCRQERGKWLDLNRWEAYCDSEEIMLPEKPHHQPAKYACGDSSPKWTHQPTRKWCSQKPDCETDVPKSTLGNATEGDREGWPVKGWS